MTGQRMLFLLQVASSFTWQIWPGKSQHKHSCCLFLHVYIFVWHSLLQMNQQHLWLSGGKRWGNSWAFCVADGENKDPSQNSYQKTNILWLMVPKVPLLLLPLHPPSNIPNLNTQSNTLHYSYPPPLSCKGGLLRKSRPCTPRNPHHYFSRL